MKASLLGSVEVINGGGPVPLGGPRARALLAHLLLRPEQLVSTDGLIDAIWGEEPPRTARNALYTYASHLRKALGPERLEGRTGGYILHLDPAEIDAFRFEALLDEARGLATSDPAGAIRRYREALALWRGPALEDLSDQPSLRGTITRLEELRMAATEELISAEMDLGRHVELVPELETLVALHPLRERLWGQLMLALYRSGRQGDALGAFLRAREILAEELGIDPSPELQRLQEGILRQDLPLEPAGEPLRGYRLLEQVGAGAFGTVHRAFQPQVGREVAVKVIHPELANDAEFIRRFESEAQLVARLEHPHVVPLYDYWREPDGAYLVMRFLRGGSLRDALSEGALDPARAATILEQTGQALAAAHRQGIVHRDVKPANILLDDEGNAYLSDFGIAKDLVAPHRPAERGVPSPLAYYISPEELHGEVPTPKSDIYNLGLVLYELLVGRHPYADAPPERLDEMQLREPVPSLVAMRPDLPASLDGVIQRATAKEPGDRYPDVAAFAAASRTALGTAREGVTPAVGVGDRNPYKGLHPFLEADAPDFFGREELAERLLSRMAEVEGEPRFLGVVGPSGSGKSSLVRAGLIPALRRGALPGSERWFVVDMIPGARPFEELAAALTRIAVDPLPGLLEVLERDDSGLARAGAEILPEGSELLLVIDQFEELFTLVEDEDARARFLAAIHTAVTSPESRVRAVVTLRADFYDRPLLYKPFGDVLAANSEAVTPLSPEEVERAVSGPAEAVGVSSDPALLADIIADVAARPGALPLLQHALLELFDRRRDGLLTVEAYREIGGISGALGSRAEDLYGRLSEAGKEAARQLFLRLVTLGEDGSSEDTRRRVLRAELASLEVDPGAMEAAVDGFGARRLLFFDRDPTTRGPTVEVAHEALLREWGRLRGWIEAAREDVKTHRRLAAAAAEWTEGGRETSFLLRGERLAGFEAWSETSRLALTRDEREYLQAALAKREAERVEEEARKAREAALEHRSIYRLRALVAVFAVLALVASGLTALTLNQRGRAEREARIATGRELSAAAVANLDVDPERSILLALEAVDRTRSVDGSVLPEAEEALHRAVAASRIILSVPDVGGEVAWSPDGSTFVTEGPQESGIIDVRDAETGVSLRRWHGHDADVKNVTFNHDGSMLATTGGDGAARVWDPETGEELAVMLQEPSDSDVAGAAFSPDGTLLAAAWRTEGVVRIMDVKTGEIRPEIEAATYWHVSFSPDGTRLAVTINDAPRTVVVVDVDSGEERFRLEGHVLPSLDVAWSPDGRWIATASWDQTARIWDAETGEPRFTLHGHTGGVVNLDWSHDGTRLVTGGTDGTAKVWEVTPTGARQVLSLTADALSTGVWGVAFSPDGSRVITGAGLSAPTVQVWDVSLGGGAQWGTFPLASARSGSGLSGVAFTPEGDLVAVDEDAVRTWDLQTGEEALWIKHGGHSQFFRIEVSPDGALIAGVTNQGVTVWDADTGDTVLTLPSRNVVLTWPSDVAWSPDGTHLAVSSDRDGILILDRAGDEVAFLPEPGFEVPALEFSPDGRLLAAATFYRDRVDLEASGVKIWDWRDGEVVQEILTAAVELTFDPGGERLATAETWGSRAHVWDVATGDSLVTLTGHTGFLWDVEFAPDGTTIATASWDGTVRLWDVDSGRQELTLRGHESVVFQARFSPDGSRLASASTDGTVRVWALDLDDLIRIANRKLTRGLTDEECRHYLRQHPCPTS